MTCPCGATPCRVLPKNGGAEWFYRATRDMDIGERMMFRAAHAAPDETRGLVAFVCMAQANWMKHRPDLFGALPIERGGETE